MAESTDKSLSPHLSHVEQALVRVARIYLRRHAEGAPDPAAHLDLLLNQFGGIGGVTSAWLVALDRFVVACADGVHVLPPCCTRLTLGEQALLTALRRTGEGDARAATAALSAVVPPTAARQCLEALEVVARGTAGDRDAADFAVPAAWRHLDIPSAVH